jgi:hypothetical protein
VALLLQTRCSTFCSLSPVFAAGCGLPVIPAILNPVGWEPGHSTCSPLSNLGISEQPTFVPYFSGVKKYTPNGADPATPFCIFHLKEHLFFNLSIAQNVKVGIIICFKFILTACRGVFNIGR